MNRRIGELSRAGLLGLLLLSTACRATTSRPAFVPVPAAATAEVELEIPEATRVLAEALARDSIPLAKIREADGYLDSDWLDARTLRRTGKRPLGRGVVRVRAWVNPSKPYWSELVVEATYRPMDDPSRPERELDQPLPVDDPLQRKIADVLRRLIEAHGNPETLPVRPPPVRRDTTRPDTARMRL